MRYLTVKNLEKFQHYKERRPPWIKLYQEILEDYAFACLQDASKAHLISLWLLASRSNNRIPSDGEWIAKAIHATEPVNIPALVNAGFLTLCEEDGTTVQDASEVLADRKQSAMPEIEREIEKETTPRRKKRVDGGGDNWVSRLAAFFREKGGTVSEGHLGRALKGGHEKYGEDVLKAAISHWLAERKTHGWTCAFAKFASDYVRWCDDVLALRQAVDSGVDYWDNEALQRLTRPTMVA